MESQRAEIIQLYDRALSIRRNALGNASFETAATLNNLGNFKRITVCVVAYIYRIMTVVAMVAD